MKTQSRKILALSLAILLMMGLFPTSGFAVEGDDPATPSSITESPAPTPEATPVPTETPALPSPTPASASSLNELFGEELYTYLKILEGEALYQAFLALSDIQIASLEGFITESDAETWKRELASFVSVPEPEAGDPEFSSNFTGSVGPIQQNADKRSFSLFSSPSRIDHTALITEKAVASNGDDKFTVALSAYTESDIRVSSTPCDIILVLDRSGSMDDTMTAYQYTPVPSSQVNRNSTYYINLNGVYTQVSYHDLLELPFVSTRDGWYYNFFSLLNIFPWTGARVSPADNASGNNQSYQFYTRTTVIQKKKIDALKDAANAFVDSVKSISPQSRIAVVSYASNASDNTRTTQNGKTYSLRPVNTEFDAIKSAINGLSTGGATRTDLGLSTAKGIYDNAEYPSGQRSKVVIVFTDGEPTSSNGFENSVANNAIQHANAIKGLPATVYSIGVFGSEAQNENITKFMNYISSNLNYRSTPLKMSNDDTPQKSGYYVYTTDIGQLEAIFASISEEMGTKIENATVKDVISREFVLTSASRATLVGDGCTITDNADGTTTITWPAHTFSPVTVTSGVPNTSNPGYFGKEFQITRTPGFVGGNNVPTNTTASGVYTGSTCIEQFTVPKANVAIQYSFSATTKNVYIGTELTPAELYQAPGQTGNDAWKYAYVTVNFSTDPAVGNPFKPSLDTNTYTVTATVNPAPTDADAKGAANIPNSDAVKFTQTATVNVFKPTIALQNLAVHLTDKPVLSSAVSTPVWKHGTADQTPEELAAMGTAPTLNLSFDKNFSSDYPADNTPITVAGVGYSSGGNTITLEAGDYTLLPAPGSSGGTHFTVFVGMPTLTCKDGSLFLGETLAWGPYLASFGQPQWDLTGAPAGLSLPSEAPTASYQIEAATVPTQFTPASAGEQHFSIRMYANGIDITSKANILNPAPADGEPEHDFTISVYAGTLTLKKTGGTAGDNYIVKISWASLDGSTQPAGYATTFYEILPGDGTEVTISGLPKGTYTVEEDTNPNTRWSWRYGSVSYDWHGDQTLGDQANGTYDDTIACDVSNSGFIPFWLSGESAKVNRFSPYTRIPAA